MDNAYPEFRHYPEAEEMDRLVGELWQESEHSSVEVQLLEEQGFSQALSMWHMKGSAYARFEPKGMAPFYGYWQPAPSQPAPLLVHTPGYGAEIQVYPSLVAQGYNILHVNPLGYTTPQGPDATKRVDDSWPVFRDTAFQGFDHGYRPWLINVMQAVAWAREQDGVLADRLGFFGTSQGGGASLLLGSVFQGRGVRCVAADEPWLTHFPKYRELKPGWTERPEGQGDLFDAIGASGRTSRIWRALGTIDTLSHAHRLTVPVLLTAGGADTTCPPETIAALYDRLPSTKSFTLLEGEPHGYTQAFAYLAAAWFRLWL